MKINLLGPDGNAFSLLAITEQLLRALGREREWPRVMREMTSRDYRHLVETMERELGEYVEFVNKEEALKRNAQ